MTSNRIKNLIGPVAVLCGIGLGLFGCGGGEYSPSHAQPGELPPVSADLSFRDLSDASITSIDLTSSAEYDEAQDTVRIFTKVSDQTGSLVPFLNEYNFDVTLEPKTVARPVDPDQTSLSIAVLTNKVVALVIDHSGSMGESTETGETRMEVAKEAARLFVNLMGADDKTAIVEFDDSSRTVQQLTSDQALLHTAIDTLAIAGATSLGAAMTEAVRAVGTRPGKRAVILLTDGDDTVDSVAGGPSAWLNNSSSTRYQGLQLALKSGLVIFTVGLGEDLSQDGLADLGTIANQTGGIFFQAPTALSLLTAFSTTIPDEVDVLPPAETYIMEFANTISAVPGQVLDIPYRISVVYENAVAVHRSKFNGSYTLR